MTGPLIARLVVALILAALALWASRYLGDATLQNIAKVIVVVLLVVYLLDLFRLINVF